MMIGAGPMRRRGSTGRLRREPLPPFLSWLVGGPRRFLLGLIILWLLYNFVTVLTGISRTPATTASPLRIHAVTSREAPPTRFPPLSPPPPAEPTGPPTFPEGGPTTVCLAFRATSRSDCEGHHVHRAPQRDASCSDTLVGPGQCEVMDLGYDVDGAARVLGTRRVMSVGCDPYYPTELQCAAAPEFSAFASTADAYRHPPLLTPHNTPSGSASRERGVVITVSDGMLLSAYTVVRDLRRQGCVLPVELWSFEKEVSSQYQPLMDDLTANYGVQSRTIEMAKEELCADPVRCFAAKPYALFHSSFESVLVLDADNFPVRDPTYLFDSEEFTATGAIFWPDYWHPSHTIFHVDRGNLLWELLGIEYVDMSEQESGQLLVNRARHERALHLLMFYALPGNLIWRWNLVWGDKDLYRLAWMRAGASFHMIRALPGAAGPVAAGRVCGLTMVQHDASGRPIFFHRNSYKMGIDKNSRKRVWEGYLRYHGDTEGFRMESWQPPLWSHYPVSSCYGHLKPRGKMDPGWELVEIKSDAELSGLEPRILALAKEAAGLLCKSRAPMTLRSFPALLSFHCFLAKFE